MQCYLRPPAQLPSQVKAVLSGAIFFLGGTKEPLSLNRTRPATHPPCGLFGVLTGRREKIGDMDFGMARGLLDKIIGMPSEIVARSLRS